MDVTSASEKRATARAPKPAPANQTPGWRQQTQDFLRNLSAPLEGVQQIAAHSNCAAYTFLVPDIKRKVGTIFELTLNATRDPEELADDVAENVLHLETLLEAAHDHREATTPIRACLAKLELEVDKFYTAVLDSAVRVHDQAEARVCGEESAESAASTSKRSAALFTEIGSLADTIRHLSISNHILEQELETEQVATLMGLRALAGQIGLIADVGAGLHGGDSATIAGANPAFWLLPPSYSEAAGGAA